MSAMLGVCGLLLVSVAAWHAGYARARWEMAVVQTRALDQGMARCELHHGASVQRGYVIAHGELLELALAVPEPRWWHAFYRPRALAHVSLPLTTPTGPSRGNLRLS